MTVRETLPLLDNVKDVCLSWDGNLVNFNFRNEIEVDVWGDYIINGICAVKEGEFEIQLAARPMKKGAAA